MVSLHGGLHGSQLSGVCGDRSCSEVAREAAHRHGGPVATWLPSAYEAGTDPTGALHSSEPPGGCCHGNRAGCPRCVGPMLPLQGTERAGTQLATCPSRGHGGGVLRAPCLLTAPGGGAGSKTSSPNSS